MHEGDGASEILTALILAGLLGMLGQGVRAVVGLKKLHDLATERDADPADLFIAAKLLISLMIGFLAGIVAGLSVGISRITHLSAADSDTMLGLAAAGYVGADVIEAFAPNLSRASSASTGHDTAATPTGSKSNQGAENEKRDANANVSAHLLQRIDALSSAIGSAALKPQLLAFSGVNFGSLVPGGYFCATPEDLSIRRSVRTNNPGALNISSWQRQRLGYVGVTQPDSAGNITTIYRTPEHGVAAWYHLISSRYGLTNFSLRDLAVKYAGTSAAQPVDAYVSGWSHWWPGQTPPPASMSVANIGDMLALGKAMFAHEIGGFSPVHTDQIEFGVTSEINGSLPP
ncbi:MAG: hypothetical protein WAU68_03815 [Vitreimonas sp.]